MSSLSVYYKADLVGKLAFIEADQTFGFVYDEGWKQKGFAISPHIPFDKTANSGTIKKFLDNLLPEGKGLEVFSLFFQITKHNTMAITREIGNETSGALSFFDRELSSVETTTRPILREELTARIRVEDPIQLIIWDGRPRLSVAGVQDKLPIIYDDGAYSFGEGKLASTHILKFETNRQRHLVLNEYICMTLAKHIGLDVADVAIERFEKKPALLVTRFDRKRVSENEIERLHVIDGCQALDLAPTHKYERNYGSGRDVRHIREGVSLKKLYDFSTICDNPIKTRLGILQWNLYNLLISNADAHGKNISFFASRKGYMLAPAYDLVCIAMYPEFEQELSMAYGDEFSLDIRAYQIAEMCEVCDLSRRLVAKELKTMSTKLLEAIEISDFKDITMDKKEIAFVEKLLSHVKERAVKYREVADEVVGVKL